MNSGIRNSESGLREGAKTMTEVEKRLISEILSLSSESRVQLVEILTQSLEETFNDDLKSALLQEIQGKEQVI
jgi:hypothetical protein